VVRKNSTHTAPHHYSPHPPPILASARLQPLSCARVELGGRREEREGNGWIDSGGLCLGPSATFTCLFVDKSRMTLPHHVMLRDATQRGNQEPHSPCSLPSCFVLPSSPSSCPQASHGLPTPDQAKGSKQLARIARSVSQSVSQSAKLTRRPGSQLSRIKNLLQQSDNDLT
jgi:hypothetical protein